MNEFNGCSSKKSQHLIERLVYLFVCLFHQKLGQVWFDCQIEGCAEINHSTKCSLEQCDRPEGHFPKLKLKQASLMAVALYKLNTFGVNYRFVCLFVGLFVGLLVSLLVCLSNCNPCRDPLLMFGASRPFQSQFCEHLPLNFKLEWCFRQILETCEIYVQFCWILHEFYKSHASFKKNLTNLSQIISWRMRQCVDPIFF